MEGPKAARPDEFESVIELVDTIFTAEKGHMQPAFPHLFNRGNAENLWIFVDEGRVVSHVGTVIDCVSISGCRLKVASAGSVGTREEYRGRGLAGACLDAGERSAVEKGASVVLISGRRSLYRRFGGIQVGKAFAVDIPAGEPAGGIEFQKAVPADIPLLVRLYEREAVRFHRPFEDWRPALDALEERCNKTRTRAIFIISRGGEAAAYVLCDHESGEQRQRTRVAEMAGSRSAIVQALPAIAASLHGASIEIRAGDFDRELNDAVASAGLTGQAGPLLGHTVKVSSVENLMHDLKPRIEERLGTDVAAGISCGRTPEGAYECRIAGERVVLDAPAFTALAFGEVGKEKQTGPLGEIFPLPLPFPGLNYV